VNAVRIIIARVPFDPLRKPTSRADAPTDVG
jgi:hypothetical protein